MNWYVQSLKNTLRNEKEFSLSLSSNKIKLAFSVFKLSTCAFKKSFLQEVISHSTFGIASAVAKSTADTPPTKWWDDL